MVYLHLAGEEIEAVVDTGASASVIGKLLARKLGIGKGRRRSRLKREMEAIWEEILL